MPNSVLILRPRFEVGAQGKPDARCTCGLVCKLCLTAYDFYLRATQQFRSTTREGLAEAIRLAHRALELDPRFGLVAALSAGCHMQNVLFGYASDPQFERQEAVRLSRLALNVDDSDPDTVAWAA